MSRRRVEVPVPALALRRAEAAAALAMSCEVFDREVRPSLPAVRVGSLVLYRAADLDRWLEQRAAMPVADLDARRRVA